MTGPVRERQRIINFPNRNKAKVAEKPPAEEHVEAIDIPKRPAYIPRKYAVEWAEMCLELMQRKRWSQSMMPLIEAAMVARVVFDQATDLMEKLEAQKAIFKYYRLLDLIPKREPGQVGRPRKDPAAGTGLQEDEPEKVVTESRWGN